MFQEKDILAVRFLSIKLSADCLRGRDNRLVLSHVHETEVSQARSLPESVTRCRFQITCEQSSNEDLSSGRTGEGERGGGRASDEKKKKGTLRNI